MDTNKIASEVEPVISATEWMTNLSREWANELGDQRQDIYTQTDGAQVDAS